MRHGAGRVRSLSRGPRIQLRAGNAAGAPPILIALRSILTPARLRSKPRFAWSAKSTLPPGGRAYARIVLRENALLLPHDRFIIRRFSPVTTIGGGVVLDIAPVRSRKASEIKERLSRIEHASLADWLHLLIGESATGMPPEDLIARTGLAANEIAEVTHGNPSILKPPGWLVDRNRVDLLRETIGQKILEFHIEHPLLPGIPRQDARSGLPEAVFDLVVKHPRFAVEGEIVRHRSHRVVLQQREEQARTAIESAFEKAGLAAPAVPDVLKQCGIEAGSARTLLQILLREGRLVRITDDLLLHVSALDRLHDDLKSIKGERLSVPAFKERTGVSRKYAIPLLKYLDRQKITRREGDVRVAL